jgi:nicotinate-nucleotide pyrophosphorylase (carboxylating)
MERLDDLVRRALEEDLGTGDVTSECTVPADARGRARVTQKAPGVIAGQAAAETVLRAVDPDVSVAWEVDEGTWRDRGPVLVAEGPTRALLAAERTMLNLLGRLSGVATLTARHVQAVEGTGARILDTRKTTPGLRALEKAAVKAGGGTNHRFGLWDAILIKENHAAAVGGVGEAVRRARAARPDLLVEAECRDLEEVEEAIAAGAPRVLLDNMALDELRAAVTRVGGRAETEASGGVSLETVRDIAATGVDFVSVGALTHSAPALDLSLLLEPLP